MLFPNKRRNKLNFIIHAPFKLTPNREGIKDDKYNKHIIKELSEFISDSLIIIKDKEYIDEDLFHLLPTNESDFDINFIFYPIFEAIKHKLETSEVLPSTNGNLLNKEKSYLFRGKELIKILNQQQISRLTKNENSGCIFPSITENSEPLYSYIKNS